nr:PREDICTED: uncharacterized protein LOC105676925 [Linepithema humile]
MRLEAFSRRRRSSRGEFVRLFSSSGSCYPAPFLCSIHCSASRGATAYIYRFKPSLDMMEQMTENDVDGIADEDNGKRLYPNTEISSDHETFAPKDEQFQEAEERDEPEEERGIYRMDEFFIGEEKLEEREYEEERYEEQSLGDEEVEDERAVPAAATISAAEKPEEEVQDAAEADHVLAEIPVEVRINLSFCVILPVELLHLTTFVIF